MTGLCVRLVYYPPYHSKYNAIERYWAGLEKSWNGGAGNEFSDIFDGVHPSHHNPGGALLEVASRELEQMAEHLGAQHRIDPVAGVNDQILPNPGHDGGEDHEYRQGDADHR